MIQINLLNAPNKRDPHYLLFRFMLLKTPIYLASLALVGTIFLQTSLSLTAQQAPPAGAPPAEANPLAETPPANFLTAEQLDTMMGPIALYPDPLLAQILPAATVPQDVVMANRFLLAKKDPALIDQQPWNESVKALARYPDVIKMMDEKLDWTTQLGKAYLAQPDDVFASVQHLRSQAAAVGNLNTTPQQVVTTTNQVITIAPADPQVIYVPTYQPTVIYTTPPPDPAVPLLAFGAGLAIGAWLSNDHDDYWYGRGNYYHGYHGGGYYGGNNSVNINNSNNINVGNGNNNIGNGNRPGNGNAGANRPGAGAGNGQRPGNGNVGANRPGAGAGNGQRPGNGNAGANRPGTGTGGASGANRPGAGTGGAGAQQRPAGGAGAQQRPATPQQRPASGGSSGFSRDASKTQQQGGAGRFGGGEGGNAGKFGGASGGSRGGAGAQRGASGGGAQRGAAGGAQRGGGGGAAQRGGGGGGGARGGGGGGGGGGRGGR